MFNEWHVYIQEWYHLPSVVCLTVSLCRMCKGFVVSIFQQGCGNKKKKYILCIFWYLENFIKYRMISNHLYHEAFFSKHIKKNLSDNASIPLLARQHVGKLFCTFSNDANAAQQTKSSAATHTCGYSHSSQLAIDLCTHQGAIYYKEEARNKWGR